VLVLGRAEHTRFHRAELDPIPHLAAAPLGKLGVVPRRALAPAAPPVATGS